MAAPTFFVDHKRGEVSELRAFLRDPRVQRDAYRKREVIKKVIAYMTLGIDVSALFSDMIMASNTKDPVQKKMIYLYLCTYAEQQADLAVMAINTLHKDGRDEDPMVRGLALRSLCSLRLPNIAEYTLPPIRQRLNDSSPYVRKTAVIGVAKLFNRVPAAVKESDLVDVLYNMLRDDDQQVVVNVVCALNEILADEGQMAINQQIVMHLLNRLHGFNEWGQCIILELVARYTPKSEDEMYDIMNLLEDRLKHANAAVVMATTKVFLNFTVNYPDVHMQVYERLKSPLLTLMGGGNLELAYAVLSHVKILVERAPTVFTADYKSFYCRYNDISAVKLIKLHIMEVLANPQNFREIVSELSEYVTDVDDKIARASIRGIGSIAVKVESALDESLDQLLGFLDLRMDYVTSETAVVLKDVLRKYPHRYEDVIPAVQRCFKSIEEAEGKAAVVWMIGEYGDTMRDAPYILENLTGSFQDEQSHSVRMELLTSAMKLFFKKPPEMQKTLGRLLSVAIEDSAHVDVRDRALMYYRLLRLDVHEAARVVNSAKVAVDTFVEKDDPELRAKVFAEFNSLSVVYNKPATDFVTGVDLADYEDEEETKKVTSAPATTTSTMLDHKDDNNTSSGGGGGGIKAPAAAVSDLLGFGDFDAPAEPAQPAQPSLRLSDTPKCDIAKFQAVWGQLPAHATGQMQLESNKASQIEGLFAARNIVTMASGTVDNVMKVYMYAENAAGSHELYLIEMLFNIQTSVLTYTIKAENSGDTGPFVELFKHALFSITE